VSGSEFAYTVSGAAKGAVVRVAPLTALDAYRLSDEETLLPIILSRSSLVGAITACGGGLSGGAKGVV
jgi:hypothetical protein